MGNHDWIWIWSIAYRNHWLCRADSKLVCHRAGSTSGDGSAHCGVSSTCGDIGSCCTDCKLQHHCGGRTSGDVSGTCHYSLPILHKWCLPASDWWILLLICHVI